MILFFKGKLPLEPIEQDAHFGLEYGDKDVSFGSHIGDCARLRAHSGRRRQIRTRIDLSEPSLDETSFIH
jgi:hypothetical protein